MFLNSSVIIIYIYTYNYINKFLYTVQLFVELIAENEPYTVKLS